MLCITTGGIQEAQRRVRQASGSAFLGKSLRTGSVTMCLDLTSPPVFGKSHAMRRISTPGSGEYQLRMAIAMLRQVSSISSISPLVQLGVCVQQQNATKDGLNSGDHSDRQPELNHM
jgi:hypothetical protein